MTSPVIPDAARLAAEAAYTETIAELRLAEGGGFKVASQQRRAIAAALEAAAPHMEAQALRDAVDAFPLETISAPDNAVVWLLRRADQVRSQV